MALLNKHLFAFMLKFTAGNRVLALAIKVKLTMGT